MIADERAGSTALPGVQTAGKHRRHPLPIALAVTGIACAVLTLLDQAVGFAQHPFAFATGAYASLFGLVGWAFWRGFHWKKPTAQKLSLYAAILLLNVLTAGYVLAWKQFSADSTPLLVQKDLDQGDDLLDQGRKDDAFSVYRDALRRSPKSFSATMRMGMVSYQMSDFERARKYYERAREIAPPDLRWRALSDLGQTYWKLQQPEEAIRLYKEAEIAGVPADEQLEWHYRLAWAYFDVGEHDAAIEHYQAVAEERQKYAAASYYNIACALTQKMKAETRATIKEQLAREAVINLRLAWSITNTDEEVQALRSGLIGPPSDRDPELAPLTEFPSFHKFLAEIRSDKG